ncbi:MAG: hypothetical protein QXU32_10740 [Nitrososphaerales archaeon]
MPRRRNPRSQRIMAVSIAAGIIGAVLGINAVLVPQKSDSEKYVLLLQEVSDQSMTLTQNYESAIGKWRAGLIDNAEMLRITDSNLEEIKSLISRLKAVEPPERFKEGHEMSILSLDYELQSNTHMRKYIETGNQYEYDKSTELLQLAFDYESKAFQAFSEASKHGNDKV